MEISPIQTATSVTAVSPSTPPEQVAEQRQLIRAVKAFNASDLFGSGRELSLGVDRETTRPVVRIVDRATKEVVQQIPSEYLLRMAEDLNA
jgi:flagellar protein FlaG